MEKLLPIGTVVNVGQEENGYISVVIVGYAGQSSEGKVYDYIGFVYPYGFISRDKIIIFESSLIHQVLYKGYEDEVFEEASVEIKEFIDEKKGEQ